MRWNSGSFTGSFGIAFTDDPWIAQRNPIEAEKLHALGYITFVWNMCEFHLFNLLCLVFGLPPRLAWILVHEMGDVSMSDRIQSFLELGYANQDAIKPEIEVIQNALAAYDVCRQNRNQFTHFQLSLDPEDNRIVLARQKGPKFERVAFPDDLQTMRRVGDEIFGLNLFLNQINLYLRNHGTAEAVPLPDRVRAPELIWKPPPQAAPKHKRPPKSSAASRRKAAMARKTSGE